MNDKYPSIQNFLNKVSKSITGKDVVEGHCATCAKVVGAFRDKLSEKEYRISRMCQECQDSVFV